MNTYFYLGTFDINILWMLNMLSALLYVLYVVQFIYLLNIVYLFIWGWR